MNTRFLENKGGENTRKTSRFTLPTRVLCVVLSMLLVLTPSNSEVSVALAEQFADGAGTSAETDGSNVTSVESGASELREAVPARAATTIERRISSADGHSYAVRVTYGADAAVPEGAELRVTEVNPLPDGWEDGERGGRPRATETLVTVGEMSRRANELARALDLKEGERTPWAKYLDVSIVADGAPVEPAAPVTIEVETDAIDARAAEAAALALLGGDGPRDLGAQAATGAGASVRVAARTDRLGELGLALVATPRFSWELHGTCVTVLSARGVGATPREIQMGDELEDGLRLMQVVGVELDTPHTRGATLWVESAPASTGEGAGGMRVYAFSPGAPPAPLVGAEGGPAAFDSSSLLALVWDSGLRDATLELGPVTVEGPLPPGATGTADDVSGDYADPASYAGDAAEGAATLAAYDIAVEGGGGEWEPGEGGPVSVTIADDAIPAGGGVAVYHVGEGGPEPVAGAEASEGSVTFPASATGTYVVAKRVTLERTLAASDGNTYNVVVTCDMSAGVPADAELRVRELAGGELESCSARAGEALGGELAYLRAFDIAIVGPDGVEVEPRGEVDVSIQLMDGEITDRARVVHLADEGGAEVMDARVATGEAGVALDFATDSFSVYAVAYTVDFHWGGYTYNLAGGNTIGLKELIARIHLIDVKDQDALDAAIKALDVYEAAEKPAIPEDDADEAKFKEETAPSFTAPVWPHEIEEFVSNIASVEFSDPTLAVVTKVENKIAVGDLVDSLGLENQFSEEMTDAQIEASLNKVLTPVDWAFISLQAFTSEETLTITMQNGDVYEINVTDAQGYSNVTLRNPTVNIKTGDTTTSYTSNLNFALTTNGLARVTGKAVNNAGTYYYIPDKITYNGKDYQVNNISSLTPAAINGRCVVFDDDLCLHMLDAEQTSLEPVVDRILASMMVDSGLANPADVTADDYAMDSASPVPGLSDARVDELARTNGFVVGEKNETSGNLFELFKRAQYDAEHNIVTIELKYFQKMKRDVPLDFIFVYDDSGTMASAASNHANSGRQSNADGGTITYSASQSVWCRIALQVILKGIMDQQSKGYDIHMAPIAFASNAYWTPDTFYSSYVSAKEAIGKIYTSGGTEHYKALNAAKDLAQYSADTLHRNPIVVYLSDFHSNANTTRAKTSAANLRAVINPNNNEHVQIYTIHMFEPNFRYDRNIATDQNHMFILNDSKPVSELLTIFDTITKDAIGYFIGKGITVQDGISTELANLSDSITMQGDANSGKSGNNVNWTFSDDATRSKAGVIYSQTITAQLKDDVVFSPSMASNATCKVLSSTDDENGNVITTEVNKIGTQPLPKGDLHMILGLLDENGSKTNNVITNAGFELYSGSSATGTPVWTGTTATSSSDGVNTGEIVIPYSAAAFAVGETYTLKQTSTDTDIAVMPDPGTWTLTVGSDYQITSSNGGAEKTPAMSVSKGEFHIWNEAKANTMTPLVPVIVKKEWNGYNPQSGDSISFTILGNDASGKGSVELPAYATNNRTDSNFDETATVTTLSASDHDYNDTPWTKIVYVPATSGEGDAKITFFDVANNQYTNGYTIKEDGVSVSAPDGEWEKTIDSTGTAPGENYTYYTYSGQEGIFDVTSSTWSYYRLKMDYTDGQSQKDYYYNKEVNFPALKNSLKNVDSFYFELYFDDTASTNNKALLTVDFGGDTINLDGYTWISRIKLPSSWENIRFTKITANNISLYDTSASLSYFEAAIDFYKESREYRDAHCRNVSDQSLQQEQHVTATPHTATTLKKQILKVTNSFTPYYTINFGTQWVDESIDENGDDTAIPAIAARHTTSDYIDAVTYTVYDGSGNPVGEPITVQKGDTLAYPTTPGSVRLPAGTYTVRQTSYTLANGTKVSTAAPKKGETNTYQFAAYAVTNDQNAATGGAYTVTVGSGTAAPVEVKFTNTRKQFQATVQTRWLPEGHAIQHDGDIPYELSYTALKADGTVEKQTISGSNTEAGNWTATHAHIPSHSVNGQETVCNVDPVMLDTLDAKYRTETETKIEGGNYTYTIINTLKQGDIILHKDWGYDHDKTSVKVLVKGYGLTQAEGYVLPEKYEEFSIGEGGGIIVTLNEENSWTHILKGYKDYKYTVEEIDPAGDIAQYVVRRYWMQTDQDTAASFTPPTITGVITGNTDSGLQEAGAEVIITNVQPICKIVDQDGVEHPFLLLNSAVAYARANKATLPMDADHPVKIQMLVDYEIPKSDKVTLDKAKDNITITTAATSGGVYNFTPTFTAAQGRRGADSREIAILKRGWNGKDTADQAMFYIGTDKASTALTTENILFDGEGVTVDEETGALTQHTGRAVYVNAGSLTVEDGSTFRNFSTPNIGGAIYSAQVKNTRVQGSEPSAILFENCRATGNGSDNDGGGAIAFVQSVKDAGRVEGATFIDCRTDAAGGAIYVKTSSGAKTFLVTNCVFDGHENLDRIAADKVNAKWGGAIYIWDGWFSLTDCDFTDCTATVDGGSVSVHSGQGDKVELVENCTFNGHDTLPKTIVNAKSGGAIGLSNVSVGVDCMRNITVTNCRTSGVGGGAYINCAVNGPRGDDKPYGVDGEISFSNCYTTNGHGGGIYFAGTATIKDTARFTFDNCRAGGGASRGGAMYFDATIGKNMTFTGAKFTDCSAGYRGGCLYVSNTSGKYTTKFDSCMFNGHKNLAITTVNATDGGAIYVYDGSLELIGCAITNLTATGKGGAICMDGGGGDHLFLTSCTISGNEGELTQDGVAAKNATQGGGIWINADTGTKLNDVTIKNCQASSDGGGIYDSDPFTETTGTVLFENCYTTGGKGGGAFFYSTASFGKSGMTGNTVTFTGCHDDSTSTTNGGGGAYFNSTLTIQSGTELEFDSCHAASYGGGAWFAGAATLNGTTSFEKCYAEKRGGGAYFAKALTLNNTVTFTGCHTDYTSTSDGGGGAWFQEGATLNASAKMSFEDCYAGANGGGAWFNGAATVNADADLSFDSCYAAKNGGGAYFAGNNAHTLPGVSFTNCKAGWAWDKEAKRFVSVAGGLGGGLYKNDNYLTLTGGTFTGCYASDKGGAVYYAPSSDIFTLNSTTITECTVKEGGRGSAIFAYNSGKLNFNGGTTDGVHGVKITNNRGAGAVEVNSNSALLTFDGNVLLYDNLANLTSGGDTEDVQKNLVLSYDSNTIINTSVRGLGADAHIGVYATDPTPYNKHGQSEQDFGTWPTNGSTEHFDAFTNDRNGLCGEVSSTAKRIRWTSYLCKLTDADGKLLYTDNAHHNAAVYQTFKAAFNALRGLGADGTGEVKLYEYDGTEYQRIVTNAINVELLKNYTQPVTDAVTNIAGRAVTLKTAANKKNDNKSDDDIYVYNKGNDALADATRATVKRGFTGESMLTQNAAGGSLTLTGVILDGNKSAVDPVTNAKYTSTDDGGIVSVAAGTLSVGANATLRNSVTSGNGGAVHVASGAKMTMDAGTIEGNTAANGAGIYLVEGSELQLSGAPSFGTNGNTLALAEGETTAKRQDIYIAGYLGTVGGEGADKNDPKLARSLIITGALNLDKGAIWVGAEARDNEENNHWDSFKQFAVFAENLKTGDGDVGLTGEQLEAVFATFRNASVADEYYGAAGEDPACVYWDGVRGGRKVILRKVGEGGEPLAGAKFTIMRGSTPINGTDINGNANATEFESGDGGVYFVGELPYGTYYIKETTAPTKANGMETTAYSANAGRWFCLIVDEAGTWMSKAGYKSDDGEEDDKQHALADATAVKAAAQQQTP